VELSVGGEDASDADEGGQRAAGSQGDVAKELEDADEYEAVREAMADGAD